MKLYNVNTEEYFNGKEFNSVIDYIVSIKEERANSLRLKYLNMTINSKYNRKDVLSEDLFYYFVQRNSPHFDIVCDTILHDDLKGYMEINEFTFQVNCFSKSIFHRILWSEFSNTNKDKFLYFVFDDWKKYQIDNKFDELEKIARTIFDQCETLEEYYIKFVYNEEYSFVSLEDVRELFDELVKKGLFLNSIGDLYQIYDNVSIENADIDIKTKYYDGHIKKIDALHIDSAFKTRTLPLLKSLNTKFNCIPKNIDEKFNGFWYQNKLGDKVWFIPQYLLFYNA